VNPSWIVQLLIMIGFLLLGYGAANTFHIPLPGSVLGLILLFLLLITGVVKLSWIEKAANFQLKHLPLLFIPSIVTLFLSSSLSELFNWYILIILIVSSTCSLLGTAIFAEWYEILKRRNEK